MFCEKCGTQINDDALFCGNCGNKVVSTPVASAPVASAPVVSVPTKKPVNLKIIIGAASAVLLILLILFIGFGRGADLSSAKLLGYVERSFEETMDAFFQDILRYEVESDEIVEFSSGWYNGWGEDSEYVRLGSGEKAVTYALDITLVGDDGEEERNRMAFYFIHDTKNNLLYVKGGYFDEDGDKYFMDKSEAQIELEYIFDEYN